MTGFVNDPLLEDHLPIRIKVEGAPVSSSTRHLAVPNRHAQFCVRVVPKLRDDVVAIMGVHRLVVITMEHNRRNGARNYSWRKGPAGPAPRRRLALAHCCECRRNVAGRAAGEPGMHADCGVEVGVGCRQNDGRRRTGCEPGGIDPFRVARVVTYDLSATLPHYLRSPSTPLLVLPL